MSFHWQSNWHVESETNIWLCKFPQWLSINQFRKLTINFSRLISWWFAFHIKKRFRAFFLSTFQIMFGESFNFKSNLSRSSGYALEHISQALMKWKQAYVALTILIVMAPHIHKLISWQLLQLSRLRIAILAHEVLGLLDADTFYRSWIHRDSTLVACWL